MTLGKDVSGLSTTAATAAARGLSMVVPLYDEAAGLAHLHRRISEQAIRLRQRYGLGCEVVYVDDGSVDATLAIARGLAAARALDVQVVSLSRNFGKEAALIAGLDHARRGAVLFMDGDGQHPPDLVEQLQPLDRHQHLVLPRRPIATINRCCGGWPYTAFTH